MNSQFENTDVVIAGAGPTGLTLACTLAQRGVRVRVFEKSSEPMHGSRGKGIQPRTLEIFDSLGAIRPLLDAGTPYPPTRLHFGPLRWTWRMVKRYGQTPDVPYPNMLLVPQAETERVLRNRLAELGGAVEYGCEVSQIEQDEHGVSIGVQRGADRSAVRARYLVAADGGKSGTRKMLGIAFEGSTTQQGRMIVGDLHVDGLSRDAWHIWPTRKGVAALCPLPISGLFQLAMHLDADEPDPELTEAAIQASWLEATGKRNIRLHSPAWLSVFRPNVRLAAQYRTGRVFLAGDAAHVHTPAGAQGLNTGVQDSWNLGWKLAAVLGGAPEALLDTYEEERRPVAAAVLDLSTQHYESMQRKSPTSMKRGDKERQLLLNYRGRTLSVEGGGKRDRKVQAGDRAPQAQALSTSLFDLYRGGHVTVLLFGEAANRSLPDLPYSAADVRVVRIEANRSGEHRDDSREIQRIYGVGDGENLVFVVRPDGYVGLVAPTDWEDSVLTYLKRICGYPAANAC